ncbi:MAG: transferrin-binding protein-like solute binding protein [Alphaproteobacteria bacterium]|nr:transferrin-binding protein-like solute binding protein [Alphaproteobacteria bacterium]
MTKRKSGGIASFAAALALAGCGGGGGAAFDPFPATDNVLPAEHPGAGAPMQTLADHAAAGGTWRVNLDGQAGVSTAGDMTLYDALTYDADLDVWGIYVNGEMIALSFVSGSTNTYEATCSFLTNCQIWLVPDRVATGTTDYGAFGFVYVNGVWPSVAAEYFHYGLKTPVSAMPVGGTASYSGEWEANFAFLGDPQEYRGTATVEATFAPDGGTVAVSVGMASPFPFDLSGSATISGNSYAGTMTGTMVDIDGNSYTFAAAAGNTVSGAFYGPDQTGTSGETAGVFHVATDPADANQMEIAGGFWAQQTSYAAP